ncbi:MAG: hypothetical protein VW518_06470, partial [Burkholderiaceae bacterium]
TQWEKIKIGMDRAGYVGNSNSPWKGWIDEVKIYGRALSQDEVVEKCGDYAHCMVYPANFTATPGVLQNVLTWDNVSGADSYTIYWSTSSPVDNTSTAITGLSGDNYTHTGLTAGTTYYYRIVTIKNAVASALSEEKSATPYLTSPISVDNVSAVSTNPYDNLSWAKETETVTLSFTVNQDPVTLDVELAGDNVSAALSSADNRSWTVTLAMRDNHTEALIAYTIRAVDVSGNSDNETGNTSVTYDKTRPTLYPVRVVSSNTINDKYAKVGDNITLTFTANELIQPPLVWFWSDNVTATSADNLTWQAVRAVQSTDPPGNFTFNIAYMDRAGNVGYDYLSGTSDNGTDNTTGPVGPDPGDNSTVVFDNSTPLIQSITMQSTNSEDPSVWAKEGDNVTLTVVVNEPASEVFVELSGDNVTATSLDNLTWTATLTMLSSHAEGVIGFMTDATDLAGNRSSLLNTVTSGQSITYDRTRPTLYPVRVTSNSVHDNKTARVGDNITLFFTSNELIQPPLVWFWSDN